MSPAFVQACLDRLMAACTLPDQAIPTSTSLSAALALVQSLEPENEIQAALAVDIACLNAASSNVLSRLAYPCGEHGTTTFANAAARLERAFHSSIETYLKLKHGNRQVIRIERVEVQAGGQAIVGSVERQ